MCVGGYFLVIKYIQEECTIFFWGWGGERKVFEACENLNTENCMNLNEIL